MRTDLPPNWWQRLAQEAEVPLLEGAATSKAPIKVAADLYDAARQEFRINEVPEDVRIAAQDVMRMAAALDHAIGELGMALVRELGAGPDFATEEEREQAEILAQSQHRPLSR